MSDIIKRAKKELASCVFKGSVLSIERHVFVELIAEVEKVKKVDELEETLIKQQNHYNTHNSHYLRKIKNQRKQLKEYETCAERLRDKRIECKKKDKLITNLTLKLAKSEKKIELVNKHEPNLLTYLENKAGIK